MGLNMAQVETKVTEKQRRFLEENAFAGVATTRRADGSPHSMSWCPSSTTARRPSTPFADARRNGTSSEIRASRCSLSTRERRGQLASGAIIDGRVELTEEGADAQIDKLAQKYLGQDTYPWRKADQTRVLVRIHSEHVNAYGLD